MAEAILLKEKLTPGIIHSLMQNFRNPIDAVLELVDNAVDDIIQGQQLSIDITVLPKTKPTVIKIANTGGTGMGLKELQGFLEWGESKKRGRLGRYGQGGKAAMGYLGRGWEIVCSKKGEEETYRLREEDWRSREEGLKVYKPEVHRGWDPKSEGRVRIEITGLERRKINLDRLSETLSDIYRRLLESKQIRITLNGAELKPLKLPTVTKTKKEDLKARFPGGAEVSGWIGIREGSPGKVKGGVRCYILGRKIVDREYFGHPDPSYKGSLGKLIGEIELGSVEPILNKTDLDRGSYEWERVQEFMFSKMTPYIRELLGEEELDLPSEKEIKNLRECQRIFEQFLKDKRDLEKQRMLEGKVFPTFGRERGQKKPEPRLGKPTLPTEEKKRGPYEPATPPPLEAIGKRRRTSGFGTWRIEPIDKITRSVVRPENGSKVLVINNIFPLYKIRKGDGWYIWETALMEYAKPEEGEEMTHQEYLDELNGYTLEFDEFLRKGQKK